MVDKDSEFYKRSMKLWIEKNDIERYSTHNEGKFLFAERFIKLLKNKIYKYMTSISQNMFIDNLDDIVNNYNSTYCRTIKMKPVDVKPNTYIDSSKEINDKDPKFKIGDIVKICFCKRLCSKFVWRSFCYKKVRNFVPWAYANSDLKEEKIVGTFCEKEL